MIRRIVPGCLPPRRRLRRHPSRRAGRRPPRRSLPGSAGSPSTGAKSRSSPPRCCRDLRPEKEGDAARRDYLQTLIDEKLLVLDARRRGIDTTRAFQAGYQYAVRRHVVDQYERRHLHPLVSISGQEVRARLARDGLDHQRLLSWIVVETEGEAARIRRRLEEGADFAGLARLHSIDERSCRDGRGNRICRRIRGRPGGYSPRAFPRAGIGRSLRAAAIARRLSPGPLYRGAGRESHPGTAAGRGPISGRRNWRSRGGRWSRS